MDKKYEIPEEELENVSGGKITFSWNSETHTGKIGIDGNNRFILLDRDAFSAYYKQNVGVMSDGAILKQLMAMGIVKKP